MTRKNTFLVYLTAWLWVMGTLAPLRGLPLWVQLAAGGEPSPGTDYTVYTAVFDGTNDWLRRTSIPTGLSDGRRATMAFWTKPNVSGDGTFRQVIHFGAGSGARFQVQHRSTNTIGVEGSNSSGDLILRLRTTGTITSSSGWTHVYIAFDIDDSTKTKIYFNGASQTLLTGDDYIFPSESPAPAAIDFSIGTSPRYTICGSGGSPAGSLYAASLAELVFDDTYLDNVAAFYNAGGPVNVGTTGSTPFGSQPVLYFSSNGSADSWTNQGSGGEFTLTGALTSDTSP